ncbi:MAG TPA: serine hydrolase [Steroidobacteraceae bacterium]|nr:serine hydrolase [Steroidobacteraceae bacterium]
MTPYSLPRLLSIVLLLAFQASQAAPPPDLDRYAQQVLSTFEVPGMAVTIVESGRPAVMRGYGVRRLGESAKVDEHTLFAIGSTTKAFTTALLSMLVDEGKLTWDTRVVDVLPGFRMYDTYVSNEMTVRDLVVHRSGLGQGAGNLLFFPSSTFNRDELVHKLRYIKPVTSFRSTYAYSNLLYMVAGQVIQSVTGEPYEDVLRKRILTPLRMSDTSMSAKLPADANRAWPHARISGLVRGFGPVSALPAVIDMDVGAAAGALNSSVADLSHWLRLQLNRGFDPASNTRLYSEAMAREMWTPQMLMPIPVPPKGLELAQMSYRAYALGWGVSDYRGQQVFAHAGSVPGAIALIVLVPQKQLAFAVVANAEESGVLTAMQARLLDHYLGLRSPDWIAAVAAAEKEKLAKLQQQLADGRAKQQSLGNSGPSLPLTQYARRYRDAWYGTATIESTASGLTLRFDHSPSLSGPLEHLHHDTFRAHWSDRYYEDAYVTFALKPDGSIERMTLRTDLSSTYQELLFAPEP